MSDDGKLNKPKADATSFAWHELQFQVGIVYTLKSNVDCDAGEGDNDDDVAVDDDNIFICYFPDTVLWRQQLH